MIKSQISLHPNLTNPFYHIDLRSSNPEPKTLRDAFENNRLILIDGIENSCIKTWEKWPTCVFSDWVPPVMSTAIRNSVIGETHPLWPFYPDNNSIAEFTKIMKQFELELSKSLEELFPFYKPREQIYSWRFNKMDLGYLHLDLPPETNDHQFRAFMNLSSRPRIIEIGPSFEDILAQVNDPNFLKKTSHLNPKDFFAEVKSLFFKKMGMEDYFLPRHTVRLAPGATWICHSSLISHGLVFGEKTVCCEWRIPQAQLLSEDNSFQARLKNARSENKKNVSWSYDGTPKELS